MKTLKELLTEAINSYERRAEWEKKRADMATEGSNIQQEILRAYQYNKGRANGIKEALDMIIEYIGE